MSFSKAQSRTHQSRPRFFGCFRGTESRFPKLARAQPSWIRPPCAIEGSDAGSPTRLRSNGVPHSPSTSHPRPHEPVSRLDGLANHCVLFTLPLGLLSYVCFPLHDEIPPENIDNVMAEGAHWIAISGRIDAVLEHLGMLQKRGVGWSWEIKSPYR